MEGLYEPAMWAPDPLHLITAVHRLVARSVLEALGAANPDPGPAMGPVEPADAGGHVPDLVGGVRYLAPWLMRAIQGRSSGDGLDTKRPTLAPPAQ